MPDLISEQAIKKTRKPHRCHGCLEVIPAGSEALANTNTDSGEIYTLYFCVACRDWLKSECRECRMCYEDPGMMEGDIKACRQDRNVG